MEKVGWRVSKINALCNLGWVNFEGQIGSSVNLRNDCEINLHFKCSHGANVNKNYKYCVFNWQIKINN